MRLPWLRLSLLCCVLCFSLSTAHAEQTLYAATDSGSGGYLYTIDPTTADATAVGPLLAGGLPIGVTGLAFNPVTGVLYGVTSDYSPNYPDYLVTINTTTAVATPIGSGLGKILTDISFNNTGMLYGWTQLNSVSDGSGFPFNTNSYPFNLVSISLTTGAATVVGTPATASGFQDGALAFSPTGILYVENNQAQNAGCCSPYSFTFIIGTVDPVTGITTEGPMFTTGDYDFNAMAFNAAGTLFASGVDSDGYSGLYTIDPTTGEPTFIGSLPPSDPFSTTPAMGGIADALAFSPVTVSPTFLLRYVSNLNIGDSHINITNDGQNTDMPDSVVGDGNLCVGVYAFDPNEELQSCCSCLVTPGGLVSLSAKTISAASLTRENPTSLVVKLLAWSTAAGASSTATPGTPAPPNSSACNAGSPGTAVGGLDAWGTTLHALPISGYTVTETNFSTANLSAAELANITQSCEFNQINGSGQFGQCPGCTMGGQ